MATYLMTFSFTRQGIQQIRESRSWVEAAEKTIQAMGGEVMAFQATAGAEGDTMFMVEAVDDEAVAGMALAIFSLAMYVSPLVAHFQRKVQEDGHRPAAGV
jgi:uncharacterized protein with GYD domain